MTRAAGNACVTWSKADDDLLRQGHARGWSIAEITMELLRDRGGGSVAHRLKVLGLAPHPARPWTPAEDEILRKGEAAGRPVEDLAAELGRAPSAVARRLPRLRGAVGWPKVTGQFPTWVRFHDDPIACRPAPPFRGRPPAMGAATQVALADAVTAD
ncbi:MAG: hypothetical protein H6842_04630 [Rhodospirillaceae bacterium]|nr:hypothetical protein [Rhodospirillaceae bacterium]